jgi:hypothetical protein
VHKVDGQDEESKIMGQKAQSFALSRSEECPLIKCSLPRFRQRNPNFHPANPFLPIPEVCWCRLTELDKENAPDSATGPQKPVLRDLPLLLGIATSRTIWDQQTHLLHGYNFDHCIRDLCSDWDALQVEFG